MTSDADQLRDWLEWAGKRQAGIPDKSIVDRIEAAAVKAIGDDLTRFVRFVDTSDPSIVDAFVWTENVRLRAQAARSADGERSDREGQSGADPVEAPGEAQVARSAVRAENGSDGEADHRDEQ